MKSQRIGYILFSIGIFIIAFTLVSDSLGFGKKGIQAAQLLLLQIGVLASVASVGFLKSDVRQFDFTGFVSRVLAWVLRLPSSIWVLCGFFIAYLLLFVFPVFLNSDHGVDYLTRYIPEIRPIGRDMISATRNILDFLSGNGLYEVGNFFYPPLYAVVFSPLVLLEYPYSYFVITAITLLSMIVSGLVIPSLFVKGRDLTVLFLFFVTVIFSYGMQFELERGQFNVIAFALSLLAIYIFHYHRSFRHLAYLLVSIAIHIKIYPVFFLLMFVGNWRDWKGNIIRFLGFGIFNVALLFVLGYQVFVDFVKALPVLLGAVWIRPYNHSLASFVNEITTTGLGILSPSTTSSLNENSAFLKIALVICFILCLAVVVVRSYLNDDRGVNFDLLLVCAIGALILPSVSVDYKLPILSPVLALAILYQQRLANRDEKSFFAVLLLIVISLSYSFTLFSFVQRPVFLGNSFPLLMIILVAITFLNIIEKHTYPDLNEN